MSEYSVSATEQHIYSVSLGANNSFKVSLYNNATVVSDLAYDLQTPSNNSLGILNLVSSTGTVDTVPIYGDGIASVISNGSAIIVSANSQSITLESLGDVDGSVTPANNSTLVYNSETDKYEVKLIELDGGSF